MNKWYLIESMMARIRPTFCIYRFYDYLGVGPKWCFEYPLTIPLNEQRLLLPQKIYIVQTTKTPWITAFSKSSGNQYW